MSGICGWLSNGPANLDDEHVIERMVSHLGPQNHTSVDRRIKGRAAVACAGIATSTGDAQELLIGVQGCPVWAPSAAREWLQGATFHERCATAYRDVGAELLQHLNGQFALAVVDQARGAMLLAVDRTGTESLCYADTPGGALFASTTDALTVHPAMARKLDPQAIYNYVYFHMVPGPDCIFTGVQRLLPGQCLETDAGGSRTHTYWQPDYRHITYGSFPERKDTLRALLRESVTDAMCGDRVGAFLSGGLDSSTVAGVLSEVTGSGAKTYSIGFDAPGYDESEFARTAARHFGTVHREYYVTPEDVVDAVPLIARTFDTPFGNASAIPAYYCAKLAADDGIDLLMGGDGGDELFGGNARYAKQWVFSLYEQLPGALRKSVLEPALGALPGVGPVRKARSYVEQSNLGMPDRIESYNLLTRLGAERVFTADYLAGVDTHRPIERVREIYRGAQTDSMLNRMLALDMRLTLADNDLRKVAGACDAAGMKVSFPLLDRRLIEFAQQLPTDWKVKRTHLRDFFKRALADFLPSEVISKTKHGFGLPFGVWMQSHPGLHTLANDSLMRLRGRGIIRPEFIDELTDTHLERHAAYYGTMVWILMMLEQWLESRDF